MKIYSCLLLAILIEYASTTSIAEEINTQVSNMKESSVKEPMVSDLLHYVLHIPYDPSNLELSTTEESNFLLW